VSLGCGQKLGIMDSEKMMDPKWSKAVRLATTDKTMRQAAIDVAKELHSKDTVSDLVKRLEGILAEKAARDPSEKRTLGE